MDDVRAKPLAAFATSNVLIWDEPDLPMVRVIAKQEFAPNQPLN